MKLIRKTKEAKTTQEAVNDLRYAYEIWLNQKNFPVKGNRTYHITITDTHAVHQEDLHFILTNSLFNRINKDLRQCLNYLNYLFVIEYPGEISRGERLPDNCKVHAHIVCNTSLPGRTLEYYFHSIFNGTADILIDETTDRTDKARFVNYLIKQSRDNRIFTDRSYNYKIALF